MPENHRKRFSGIYRDKTNQHLLNPQTEILSAPPILSLSRIDKNRTDQVESKLKNNPKFTVSNGFVLTTKTYNLYYKKSDFKA